MDMNYFRNIMAEHGFELTPKCAARALKYLKEMHQYAIECPEQIKRLESLSEDERRYIRCQLAEVGTEVTPEELDSIISLLMKVYENIID